MSDDNTAATPEPPSESSLAAGRKMAEEYGKDPDPDFGGWRRYEALRKKLGRIPTAAEQIAERDSQT